MVELAVGVALREVAVELLETARELLRAVVVAQSEGEREVGREHRDDVLARVERSK